MVTRDDIFQFFERHYDTKPNFLWDKFPNYAVFQHKKNEKWYALVMDVLPEKFDLEGNEKIDVLNVKSPSELNGSLREREYIFEGYHMNKEHWNSIVLDRVNELEDIEELIETSFDLTKK